MAKETLSPHELNKYTYCNYQWYYEKKYGRKQLYDMKKNQVQKKQSQNRCHCGVVFVVGIYGSDVVSWNGLKK